MHGIPTVKAVFIMGKLPEVLLKTMKYYFLSTLRYSITVALAAMDFCTFAFEAVIAKKVIGHLSVSPSFTQTVLSGVALFEHLIMPSLQFPS